MRKLAVLDAGQAEDKPQHASVGGKGGRADAAEFLCDEQDGDRDELAETGAPDLFLDLHTFLVFLERYHSANDHAVSADERRERRLRRRR